MIAMLEAWHRPQPKTPADILNTDTITKSQRKAIRKAIKHSDPMSLREAEVELPDQTPEECAGRQRLFRYRRSRR